MSRRNNPNTQPSPDNGPNTPELSADMSREELLEYYDSKISRAKAMAVATGHAEDEWTHQDVYNSGEALNYLKQSIDSDPTYQPSEIDVTLGSYIDADLRSTENYNAIDGNKIVANYAYDRHANVTDKNSGVAFQLNRIEGNLQRHNDSIVNKLNDPTTIDNGLSNQKNANTVLIGRIENAKKVQDEAWKNELTALDVLHIITAHKNGQMSDDELATAKRRLDDATKILDRAGNAYLLVSDNQEFDFKDDAFVAALNMDVDTVRAKAVAQQQRTLGGNQPQAPVIQLPHPPRTPATTQGQPAPAARTTPLQSPGSHPPVSLVHPGRHTSTGTQQPGAQTGTPPITPVQAGGAQHGNQPPRGTATHTRGANIAPMAIPASTADLQRNNVNAAARQLAESMRGRSVGFFGKAENDETAHSNFRNEVQKMMAFEKPDWFDAASDEEKVQYANQYVAHYYNETVKETVDGMAGEKDEKKRKRNRRMIRVGSIALGCFLGGPVGGAVAGAISLGVTKAIDSEYKNRKKLYGAVNEYVSDDEVNELLDTIRQNHNGNFDFDDAFAAASTRLMKQVERGVVNQRRRNIGFAGLKGLAWTGGSLLVMGQGVEAAHHIGDTAYQWVSKASWSGTHTSWAGGLNPNFNYTMHEKPVSWKVLEGLWKVSTSSWGMAGASVAGIGGAGYLAHKKRTNARKQSDFRLAG